MYTIVIIMFTLVCMCYARVEENFSKNSRIFINFLIIVYFSILVACRPLTVPDTYGYIDLYKQIDIFTRYTVNNLMVIKFDSEIGYVIFCQIAKFFLGESYGLFLFMIPVINISLIVFGSKRIILHANKEFSVFNNVRELEYGSALIICLYTSYFGLLYNGIALRAGFGLSLTVCALAMYLDKKYVKMVIFCVIALLFHKMALIGVIVIAVFHLLPIMKRLYYIIVWLFIGVLAIYGIGNKLIELIITLLQMLFYKIPILNSLSHYLINNTSNGQFGYKNLFFYLIGLVLLFWKFDSKIYYKLLNIYYVGLITMVLLNNIDGSSRIYDFMTIYMVLALYILYRYGKGNKNLKWILTTGIVLVSNVLVLSVWGLL